MATTELHPKETKSKQTAREWQSSVWVWRFRLVVTGLSNRVESYFVVWWSRHKMVMRKVSIKIQKSKKWIKGRNAPGQVVQH